MKMNRSLKTNTNENDKTNDIRLSLKTPKGSKIVWILVEGEDDCKIYPKFFNVSKAKVEYINGGKVALAEALKILSEETQQVLGIQDADFSHLTQSYSLINNLFYTDYHDIEMTMFSFESVRNNILTEYQLQDKQQTIWQNILEEASYIGYIRWYNDMTDSRINFKGLNYGDLNTTKDKLVVLEKNLLLEKINLRSKNRKHDLTQQIVDKFIVENKSDDILNLCNGHDVVDLFSLLLVGYTNPKSFAKELRLSFTNEHFTQTKLHKQLQQWQTQTNFTIL